MATSFPFNPEAHLAAIVRGSDDAIVSKTLDGTIISWNRGAERVFGYPAAEAVGRSIRMIIPRDRWQEEDEVLRRVSQGEEVDHFETVRQRRDGSPVVISLTVSPIRDASGRIIGASKIARDISFRRQAEEERTRLLAAAESANLAKDQFLAVLSHELRTPLNAILGWSEVLRQTPVDPALAQRGLDAIARNVKAQAKLVDDLLDISRIGSGKMRLEVRPVELAPIVEAALEAVGPAALAKRVGLQRVLDPGAVVLGDAGRLQQVMWNLLSNAIKFTPAGGWVQVILSGDRSLVEVAVSDTGSGITPEYLPFVFDRFSQADSSMRRQFGGLGLGLAITRELVQMHGGTVEARSEGAGHGATFIIQLPRSVVSALSGGPGGAGGPGGEPGGPRGAAGLLAAEPPFPDLTGVRVLVVDDDPGNREVTEAFLHSLGAEVLLAVSAAAARTALAGQRPDVLVADIGMPLEDGYSLLRSVRALPAAEGGTIPAIALTAMARSEDRWQALDAGFHLHLAKPAEPRSLAVAIAQLAAISIAARALHSDP
jgi:PAS domain S-box-containing protein